jgi:hypothetical protein
MNGALTAKLPHKTDEPFLDPRWLKGAATGAGLTRRGLANGQRGKSNQKLYHLLFWDSVLANYQGGVPFRVGVLRRPTMDALLEREITAAQRWRILTELMDEFEWVHGRPSHTFEEFQAWLATASGRRAVRKRIED